MTTKSVRFTTPCKHGTINKSFVTPCSLSKLKIGAHIFLVIYELWVYLMGIKMGIQVSVNQNLKPGNPLANS